MEGIRPRASVECQAARTGIDGIITICSINRNRSVGADEMKDVVAAASKNNNGDRARVGNGQINITGAVANICVWQDNFGDSSVSFRRSTVNTRISHRHGAT